MNEQPDIPSAETESLDRAGRDFVETVERFAVVRVLEDPIHDRDAHDLSSGKLKRMRPERRRFRASAAAKQTVLPAWTGRRSDDEVDAMLRRTMERFDEQGIAHDV